MAKSKKQDTAADAQPARPVATNDAKGFLRDALVCITGDDNPSVLARECVERALKWLDRVEPSEKE